MKPQLRVMGINLIIILSLFTLSINANLGNAEVTCVDRYNYASMVPCSDQNAVVGSGNMTTSTVNATTEAPANATSPAPPTTTTTHCKLPNCADMGNGTGNMISAVPITSGSLIGTYNGTSNMSTPTGAPYRSTFSSTHHASHHHHSTVTDDNTDTVNDNGGPCPHGFVGVDNGNSCIPKSTAHRHHIQTTRPNPCDSGPCGEDG